MTGNEQAGNQPVLATHPAAPLQTYAVTVKLEGSELLLQALDDHMRTCELAKTLIWERDTLAAQVAELRRRYENQA